MTEPSTFQIEPPRFEAEMRRAVLTYKLGELSFTETLDFPDGFDPERAQSPAFARLLDLTTLVLGTSYYKLKAPYTVAAPLMALTESEIAFVRDVYENGLGEFYARNDLKRFGKIAFEIAQASPPTAAVPGLEHRILLPIGGGKDSLVSVQLLDRAGIDFIPFAVNPKGPILTSVERIGRPPLYVTRTLDAEMIRLSNQPGFYNGHVPMTAINSMIAALVALLFGYDTIALSNERSASEGNLAYDGREANHQYSKSRAFEEIIAKVLAAATGGGLRYFSLLRPYSEARIAALFARETRFDHDFSSCNRNFRLSGHDGPLWCGECPKCHFTFLILAPHMDRDRLIGIFGANLLDRAENVSAYRELAGLAGQKPWECVGEILEAAACLFRLSHNPDWRQDAVIAALRPDLLRQYGEASLEAAWTDLMADTEAPLVPVEIAQRVAPHAL